MLLLAATIASIAEPAGVKLALTQHFLDYVLSIGTPLGVDFLRTYQFPEPASKGDNYSISWSVDRVKLAHVALNTSIELVAPSSLRISVFNLKLQFAATHPSAATLSSRPWRRHKDSGIGQSRHWS